MKLYPYQEKGVKFIRSTPRAYLADEMGLGKSAQAIVALRDYPGVVVIAPARTLPNWEQEADTWGEDYQSFLLVSYTKLARDYHEHWEPISLKGTAVVLDEAHYCKNSRAKRTKAALQLAADAPKAVLLSGTPMPNDARELYPVFRYLWPEAIPDGITSAAKWRDHFCQWTPTQYGPRVYGHKNASQLIGMLRGRMLRRKLDDVGLDLPPLRVTYHALPNDAVTQSELDEVLADFDAENAKDDPSSSRVRRLVGTLKAPVIADTLAYELEDGAYKKLVVMYHHTDVGNILAGRLKMFGLVRLDGRTKDSAQVERMFREEDSVRVFLGQMTAAGTGLNLQVASELAIVEPAWTPDENRQAIKRIHRIGQDAPCRARVFGVEDTQDAAIMRTIALKSNLQESVGLR